MVQNLSRPCLYERDFIPLPTTSDNLWWRFYCCGTNIVWGSRLGTNNPACLVGIKVRDKLLGDNSVVRSMENSKLAAGEKILAYLRHFTTYGMVYKIIGVTLQEQQAGAVLVVWAPSPVKSAHCTIVQFFWSCDHKIFSKGYHACLPVCVTNFCEVVCGYTDSESTIEMPAKFCPILM